MEDLLSFMKLLASTPGLTGREAPIRQFLLQAWEPFCDVLEVSRLGSLHGLQRGTGEGERPRLLLAAHMDRIGLMVTCVEGELIRIRAAGGIDRRVLAGAPVTVHGRSDLPGRVIMPAARLRPVDADGYPELDQMWVDTGLPGAELQAAVQPGDMISYAQEPLALAGGTLAGPGMDNRVSVAALTLCLEELHKREHGWDVWAVASVQEELSLAGSATSSFQLQPGLGIAIDATFAKGPGSNEYNTFPLGKGLSLGWGPDNHPGLYRAVADTADRLGIAWAPEFMPSHSGTDATAIQVTADGIPALAVSIPIRYMHSPVEMVSLTDIESTGRLLAEFIIGLPEGFLDTLTLEGHP